MERVTGKTRICALLGDPVEHTISPVMQNAAFRTAGLDYLYVPLRVESGELGAALLGARAMHMRGLNITIPHKVSVLALLDDIDEMAQSLGAVNTIVNDDGCLKGYNTDAAGFYRALTGAGVDPAGRKTTILGAGGAARAVAFILADKGAQLTVLNRDERRALRLADDMMRFFRCEIKSGGLNLKTVRKTLPESEIVVNTTSVGMLPQIGVSPLPAGLIARGQTVFDIIYNPLQTSLLAEAEQAGARVIGGIEMLVQQGAAAFELWTGCAAPLDTMRQAALEALA